MARRWVRRFRSPTIFSTLRRPPSNSASAPARTPTATRGRSSRFMGSTAPSGCATPLSTPPLRRSGKPVFSPRAMLCALRRASLRRGRNEGLAMSAFNWADPFDLESQLTEEERLVQKTAFAYAKDRLRPRVLEAFRQETTDPAIFREMGELGFLGPTVSPDFGGAGLGYVAYGLIAREVERIDSGYRSM